MSRMQHRWRLPLLGALTLALLLCCGAQGQAQELSQSRIWNSVLDRVNLKLLFAPVSVADAQGAELSITTILNLIFVPATETESAYLRSNASGGDEGGPPTGAAGGVLTGTYPDPSGLASNVVGTAQVTDNTLTSDDLATGSVGTLELVDTAVTPGVCGSATEVCQPTFDADGRATLATTVPILATTVTGAFEDLPVVCTVNAKVTLLPDAIDFICIEEDPLDEADERCGAAVSPCWFVVSGGAGDTPDFTPTVDTIRFRPLSQAETCILDTNSVNIITPHSDGTTTCTLPSAADNLAPGFYHIINAGPYALTLDTTGTDVINPGALSSLSPITGPGASFTCYVESETSWNCTHVTGAGYGEPWTSLCALVNGSTNNAATGSGAYIAHNLSCQIPVNVLKVGSVLRTCAAWELVTGSAAPALSSAFTQNGTIFASNTSNGWGPGNSIAARTIEVCAKSVVEEAPSAASAVWSFLLGDLTSLASTSQSSTITQPQDWITNAPVVLGTSSKWLTAGTGTSTYRLMMFTVDGVGLQ